MDSGGVTLMLGWDGRQVVTARVTCERPQAARLLEGRPVAEATALVPRLFSLCAGAQGVAARLAVAAAQGQDDFERSEASRYVALECIGEHLWRLLLDWPPLLGLPPQRERFLSWRKLLLKVSDAEAAASLGSVLLEEFAAFDEFPLPDCRVNAAPATRLLPWRSASEWAAALPDGPGEAFAARPEWQGLPAETGVLARQADDPDVDRLAKAGNKVGARLRARQADLRLLAQGLLTPECLSGWVDACGMAPGFGLARVETARGLLLHLTQVKDGRVERYVIVAPTEWNFHPQGAFIGEIVGCPAATRDEAEMLARRLTLALDPCVGYEVVVEHA